VTLVIADLEAAPDDEFARYWRRWPLAAWTGELTGRHDGLFRIRDDRFVPRFVVDAADQGTVADLVSELVDWRLAQYLDSKSDTSRHAITLRVTHANGSPILRYDRSRDPEIPTGWTEVMADGAIIELNFVKIAVNVGRRPGEQGNALHGLLRTWFGPSAGHPGTAFEVILERTLDRWTLRPRRRRGSADNVVPLFPSLGVACGAFDATRTGSAEEGWQTVRVSVDDLPDPSGLFVAIASGESMAGGSDPVHDGDHLLFRWARDVSLRDLEGKRVLVELEGDERRHALKRLARTPRGFELRSDNDEGAPPIAATRDMRVVATYVRHVDSRDSG